MDIPVLQIRSVQVLSKDKRTLLEESAISIDDSTPSSVLNTHPEKQNRQRSTKWLLIVPASTWNQQPGRPAISLNKQAMDHDHD